MIRTTISSVPSRMLLVPSTENTRNRLDSGLVRQVPCLNGFVVWFVVSGCFRTRRSFLQRVLSVFANRDTGPVVRTKRRSRQPRSVVEITHGTVGPGVAHCHRMRHVFAPNNDCVTFKAAFRPNESVIRARNG